MERKIRVEFLTRVFSHRGPFQNPLFLQPRYPNPPKTLPGPPQPTQRMGTLLAPLFHLLRADRPRRLEIHTRKRNPWKDSHQPRWRREKISSAIHEQRKTKTDPTPIHPDAVTLADAAAASKHHARQRGLSSCGLRPRRRGCADVFWLASHAFSEELSVPPGR